MYDNDDDFDASPLEVHGELAADNLGPGWGKRFWAIRSDEENGWRQVTLSLSMRVSNSGETPAVFVVEGDFDMGVSAGPQLLMAGESKPVTIYARFTVPAILALKIPRRLNERSTTLVLEDGSPLSNSAQYLRWSSILSWHDVQQRVSEELILTGSWNCFVHLDDHTAGVAEHFTVDDLGRAQPRPRQYVALE